MLDLQTMKLFFAMLTVVVNIAVLGYLAIIIAARWSRRAAELKSELYDRLDGLEMLFGSIVAGTAMLGSLYLSEIANLPPCRMCWYQRFAMYPTAIVLGLAAWRRYTKVRIPVMVTITIGAGISIYHYLIQWFPSLEGTSCSISVPCTTAWFRVFGFVSIPYMAISAFAFVFVMMLVLRANTSPTLRAGVATDG
ncbi:MAG: disulfide bond formation protein B [Acidimicrobiia bacterium]|nr:disulfide bond formation protein B [Acidimicrobiia bacterium]MDX2465900.1 disulfide bond formation protein B [Acidimicrobiia bacterium]